MNLGPEEIAYIGDDLTDIHIMDFVGYTACPADAIEKVKNKVDIVLTKNGGHGCIREFVEEHLVNYR